MGFILGFFVGLFVAHAAVNITAEYSMQMGFTVLGTIGCTLLGTIQWLLLRKWVSQSQNWIWTNTIGGLVATIIGLAVARDGSDSGLIFMAIVLGFLVYTAITGEILIRLLKNPISKS